MLFGNILLQEGNPVRRITFDEKRFGNKYFQIIISENYRQQWRVAKVDTLNAGKSPARLKSVGESMASRRESMDCRLESMTWRRESMALRVESMTSRRESMACRLEAMTSPREPMASRLESMTSRRESVGSPAHFGHYMRFCWVFEMRRI